MHFLNTPYQFSLSTYNQWITVDLSNKVPANAAGAIIRFVSISSIYQKLGVRHVDYTGSNLQGAFAAELAMYGKRIAYVGFRPNDKIIAAYAESSLHIFYLIGYFDATDGVFFSDNPPYLDTNTSDWTDWDLSGYIPDTAKAGIFYLLCPDVTVDGLGVRPKGSSESPVGKPYYWSYCIVKLDGNRKVQVNLKGGYNNMAKVYCIGYLGSCGSFNVDGSSISCPNPNVWTDYDVSGFSPVARGLIIRGSPGSGTIGVRPNGSSDTFVANALYCPADVVGAVNTSDDIAEVYKTDSSVTLYLHGYFYDVNVYEENPVIEIQMNQEPEIALSGAPPGEIAVQMDQSETIYCGPHYVQDEMSVQIATGESQVARGYAKTFQLFNQIIIAKMFEIVISSSVQRSFQLVNRLAEHLVRIIFMRNQLTSVVQKSVGVKNRIGGEGISRTFYIRNALLKSPSAEVIP